MIAICRDEDCPKCGWVETYAECSEEGVEKIGCRKCGWTQDLRATLSDDQNTDEGE